MPETSRISTSQSDSRVESGYSPWKDMKDFAPPPSNDRHGDLKARALATLHPTFKKNGPANPTPLPKSDHAKAKARVGFLRDFVAARIDYKSAKLASLRKRWFTFSDLGRREARLDSLKSLQHAATDFETRLNDLHAAREAYARLRATPIPRDAQDRALFLDALKDGAAKVARAAEDLSDASERLRDEFASRDELLKASTSRFRSGHKYLKEMRTAAYDAITATLGKPLVQETNRLGALHRRREARFEDLRETLDAAVARGDIPKDAAPKVFLDRPNSRALKAMIVDLKRRGVDPRIVESLRQELNPIVEDLSGLNRKIAGRPQRAPEVLVHALDQEVDRVDDLAAQLKRVEKIGGPDALDAILGGPRDAQRLVAGDALQALRAGDAIGPFLKDVHDRADVLKTAPKHYASGGFNSVMRARARFPGAAAESDWILKPLAGDVKPPGSQGDCRLPEFQTRSFSRQLAAHRLSQRLGLNLVAEPKLVRHDGRLMMAMPKVPGRSPVEHVERLYDASGTRQRADANLKALHENPNLQRRMKDVQLFHALTGNVDGHGCNLNVRFVDPTTRRTVDIAALAERDDHDALRKLDVEVGLFDMDGAFTGVRDPLQTTTKHGVVTYNASSGRSGAAPKINKRAELLPGMAHNIGPPPFHSARDLQIVDQLIQDLEQGGAAREELAYLLTGDEALNATGHKSEELDAMKARAEATRDAMIAQRDAGAQVDDSTTGPEMDALVGASPKRPTYHSGEWGYVERHAACIEKFFPRRDVYRGQPDE